MKLNNFQKVLLNTAYDEHYFTTTNYNKLQNSYHSYGNKCNVIIIDEIKCI